MESKNYIVLKEWKIWSFANSKMTKPTNRDELEEFEALETRAQRVILDGVKYHLIPHLTEKKTTKDMWDTLNQLFEAKNENRKMTLKDKLHNVKMNKDECVASYLTPMSQGSANFMLEVRNSSNFKKKLQFV